MPTKQTFTAGQVLTAAQLNTLQDYVGVVQVKSTTKSDTFTMSSATFADVTGLSVSITPTSASNKILVVANVYGGSDPAVTTIFIRLMRDSTAIGIGDAASNRKLVSASSPVLNVNALVGIPAIFLDSPNTTSATTYKVQISAQSANAVYVNRSNADTDATTIPRSISTITVYEVTP
jgi:hypothetical protein